MGISSVGLKHRYLMKVSLGIYVLKWNWSCIKLAPFIWDCFYEIFRVKVEQKRETSHSLYILSRKQVSDKIFSCLRGQIFGPYLPAQIVLTSCQNTCLFLDWCDGLTVKNMLFRIWWADCQKTWYFWTDWLTDVKNMLFLTWWAECQKTWYFWTDGLTNNGKPLRLGYWMTMTSV